MDNWFSYDLKESEYQLKIYEMMLHSEKLVNGKSIAFYKDMISRLKSDIKNLKKGKTNV